MESFNKFHPLFLEARNNERIGICRWIESGTTIDTAVPELLAMTSDKSEWRAIIVHMYSEAEMLGYSVNPANPFDFDINRKKLPVSAWEENKVPLIRLTQLIGGVPVPQLNFTPKEIHEPGKAPRIIYKPDRNEDEEALYEQIAEKYRYQGKPPSEIILISIRKSPCTPKDVVENAWQFHNEYSSDEFWKINCYPSVCRFMFYEMERQGPVVEVADIFRFWSSVMLLSVNKIAPSSLQAYRLYRFNIHVNPDQISLCFQETLRRLLGARTYISQNIRQEANFSSDIAQILPDYDIDVPVPFVDVKHRKKDGIKHKEFGLIPNSVHSELGKWNSMKKLEDEKTKTELDISEQSLDRTADKVRDFMTFSESGSFKVDKFQLMDVKAKLDGVYRDVLRIQSELPKASLEYEDDLHEADKSVRDKILERLSKRKAFCGYGVVAGLALLLSTSTVYFYMQHELGSILSMVILVALCLFVPAMIEIAVLLHQRRHLRKKVLEYKKKHSDLMVKLHNNVSLYSDYMSGIATHARGSSFLRTVQKQKMLKENSYTSKQKHIRDINMFIANLEDWHVAFYCKKEQNESAEKQSVFIDTETPSIANHFYTFDYGMSYQVPLDNTGDMLESPVNFIDKFFIEREGLYDNNRSIS